MRRQLRRFGRRIVSEWWRMSIGTMLIDLVLCWYANCIWIYLLTLILRLQSGSLFHRNVWCEKNGMSIEWMSARWWHSRPLSMNWQWKNLMEIFHRVLACHNEMEPQWYCRSVGGQNWVRGSGGELTNSIFNTTMKWEMGETTIGVIPYYNSELAVDILHGRVHHIQSKGGIKI